MIYDVRFTKKEYETKMKEWGYGGVNK